MIRDMKRMKQLLESTRAFVRDVAIPNEERVEREGLVPDKIVAQMRELGFFGWSIPRSACLAHFV